jgi:hypothetical protein
VIIDRWVRSLFRLIGRENRLPTDELPGKRRLSGVFSKPDHNRQLRDRLRAAANTAIQAGHDPQKPSPDVERIVEATARENALAIGADASRLSASRRETAREFERRLWDRWGPALELFEATVLVAEEAGADFNAAHRPAASKELDYVFGALILLHGRACLTASEVLELLRTGHPFGAHARWRTLHEIAVVGSLIGEHGQEIAERYLLFRWIQEDADAREYQLYSEALGYVPYTDAEMEMHRQNREALIERFGKSFAGRNGWAVPLFKEGTQPSFKDLERRAGMDHLRPHYSWSSHPVHAGSKGSAMAIRNRGGYEVILTGPTNYGLADPGHGALISLLQITTTLLIHGRPKMDQEPMRAVVARALALLVDQAGELFLSIHRQLEEDEKKAWAERPPNTEKATD